MPATDRAADLALAEAAAREAAEHALWLAGRGFETWTKAPGNPVTSADLEVDALLKARLLGDRPDYGWLSEETADSLDRLAAGRLWVVDPIDGTRDFARGRDGWAVSVALVEAGAVVLGVLVAPALARVYVATESEARLNGKPIRVSGRTEEAGARAPVEPQFARAPLWPEPWRIVPIPRPNSLALRLALVATGEADGAIDGRRANEWDVAAASLLVIAAGGVVSDRTGAPIRFNKPEPELAGVIAATPALHPRFKERLAVAHEALARAGIRLERG